MHSKMDEFRARSSKGFSQIDKDSPDKDEDIEEDRKSVRSCVSERSMRSRLSGVSLLSHNSTISHVSINSAFSTKSKLSEFTKSFPHDKFRNFEIECLKTINNDKMTLELVLRTKDDEDTGKVSRDHFKKAIKNTFR